MKANEPPIIIEEYFNLKVDKVWKAITNLVHMRNWYFENIPEFKAEEGFETEFVVKNGSISFPHKWRITKVIPNELIEYDWSYDGYEGRSIVTFKLFDENNRTRLRLTHTVTEDFPQDIQEFKRESGIAGWKYFINDRLREYLS